MSFGRPKITVFSNLNLYAGFRQHGSAAASGIKLLTVVSPRTAAPALAAS